MPNKNKCFKTNDATMAWRDRARKTANLKKTRKKWTTKKGIRRRGKCCALIKYKWSQRLLTPNHRRTTNNGIMDGSKWTGRWRPHELIRAAQCSVLHRGKILSCAAWTRRAPNFMWKKLSLAWLILASSCVCAPATSISCRNFRQACHNRGDAPPSHYCKRHISHLGTRGLCLWTHVCYQQHDGTKTHTFDRQTCRVCKLRLLERNVWRISASSCLLSTLTRNSLAGAETSEKKTSILNLKAVPSRSTSVIRWVRRNCRWKNFQRKRFSSAMMVLYRS